MTTLISNIAIGKSVSVETLNQINQAALTGLRDGVKCTSGHFLMYKVAGCDRWLNIQPGARIDDTFLMSGIASSSEFICELFLTGLPATLCIDLLSSSTYRDW